MREELRVVEDLGAWSRDGLDDGDEWDALIEYLGAGATAILGEGPDSLIDERTVDLARQQADHGEDRDEPRTPLDRARGQLIAGDAILDLPAPDSLVGDILQVDSLAELYGPSGCGKTFLALDLALHVARGAWWHGREVIAGSVLYVIAEGAYSLSPRVCSWLEHHSLTTTGPITWLPTAPNLLHHDEVGVLIEIARELRPSLVVVDTLARCMVGGDENSARDMGVAVDNLDRIRRATGACILAIHHTGKDESAGARGSSALRGAVDTEVEARGDHENLALTVRKQRNGPDGPVGRFHLKPVGDSCVIAPRGHEPDDLKDAATLAMIETLDAIDTGTGVPTGAWLTATEVGSRTFYRRVKVLLERGLTANLGTDARPRYALTSQGRTYFHCHGAT